MFTIKKHVLLLTAFVVAIASPIALHAQERVIETAIGPVETEMGVPTPEAAKRLYDEMDLRNAVNAYIWAVPAVGSATFHRAWEEVYGVDDGEFIILDTTADRRGPMTSNPFATYVIALANLAETGPLILEDPAGNHTGPIGDLWWREVGQIGNDGPFKGAGGRLLILGPEHKDPGAEGYVVIRSSSNHIFIGTRFLDLDKEKAIRELGPLLRAYPFRDRDNPPDRSLIRGASREWVQAPPPGIEYFELLADLLRDEPVAERDRFFMAMLSTLGIKRGEPFNPTRHQREILTEAAKIGELTMRAAMVQRRAIDPYWAGRQWKDAIYLPIDQRTPNFDHFEERAVLYYEIFGFAPPTTGPGSGFKYMVSYRDADGDLLDGGKNYRLHVPADPPADLFWSVTAYDEGTRGFVPNTDRVGLGPQNPGYEVNPDGSVDVYFGPTPPESGKSNWIQTTLGRPWFTYFRLFLPTEPFFDRSWVLPDIESVD
jgi:hypothetical protein